MKEDKAIFIEPKWSGWKFISDPSRVIHNDGNELIVDEKMIGDIMHYGSVTAKIKEPFLGAIINIFMRMVSSFIPATDFKYAYVLDFGESGKVDLFLSNDIWNSHAEFICQTNDEDLDLLLNSTKEYIRYRCFLDGIQPLER